MTSIQNNSGLDYQYDNCYYLNPTFKIDNSDQELNDFLNANFHKNQYSLDIDNSLNECKELAISNQKDLFLVSNLKQNNGLINYTCYVPKVDTNCDFSNITDFVSPFNETLKKLLGPNEDTRKEVKGFFELSSNNFQGDYSTLDKINFNDARCFKLNDGTSNFGKIDTKNENDTTFALYKTDIILDQNMNSNIFNNPNYTNMHTNYETHNTNFQNNFNKSEFESLIDTIKNRFNNYLCDKDRNSLDNVKERAFDDSITSLGNYYNTMFFNLNELSKDISNVYIIAKYDLHRLSYLEKKIKEEKQVLSNLLGFDGASNGKLFDTKYLKNIKLSETIILSLIIIFLIYFYAKKK
tara:strand:+ start:3348 stop:4403 length:1056 start_codon:yes stop_codon:yes gene_type:complete